MIGRKSGRRTVSVLLACCVAMLAFVGVAQADVATVGASFPPGVPPGESPCPSPAEACSLFMREASSPSTGTVAERDGTVVRFRLDYPKAVPGYSISVVRRNADGTYTVTATSLEVTPTMLVPEPEVETFGVNLPIKAGEFIALNIPVGGSTGQFHGSFFGVGFEHALSTGETLLPVVEGSGPVVVGYNADISYAPVVGPPAPEVITKEVVRTVEVPAKEAHCVVPKLQGKKLKAAKAKIRAAGCKVGLVSQKSGVKAATAKVVAQSPKPATALPLGTPISLKLG
jgi:PASTA domain